MSTIVLRGVKGTPLTNAEVDANFNNLNTDKLEAATVATLTNKTINLANNTLQATSAQLAAAVSDETGSGALVFANSPTLATPNLGTPSAVTLTNATGLPVSTGISGLGTGVATALAVNTGTAGAFVVNGGALGTPSSGTVTNLTGTASININGTVGATTPNTGAFTTLTTSSTVTLNGGTANGVAYLNGSKVLTTGSALTFDGTNFATTGGGTFLGGPAGYGGGEVVLGPTTSGVTSAVWTQAAGSPILFFDHRGASNTGVFAWRNGTGGASELMRLTSTGLGIGTSSPSNTLTVKSTSPGNGITIDSGASNFSVLALAANGSTKGILGAATANGDLVSGSTAGDIVFRTSSTNFRWTTDGGSSSALVLNSSGNLGLGVTPSAWDFGGNLVLPGAGTYIAAKNINITFGANLAYTGGAEKYVASNPASKYYQGSGTHAWFTAPSGTAGNAISFTQAMTLDASGLMVGRTGRQNNGTIEALGTGAQAFVAQVTNNANSLFQGFNAAGSATFFATGNGDVYLYSLNTLGSGALPITVNGTERARIDSSGNFVVARGTGGDTTVGFTAYANGTVTAARSSSNNSDLNLYVYSTGAAAARFYVGMGGTVYATSTTITAISDQRLKENIQDIDVGLEKVLALKPRKFDWKEGKGKNKKGDRGWIAQEFEQVFPDMIDTWADPAPEGEEPYKAVNADLIPVLVKAIQEQQAQIEQLRAEIQTLKGN